MQKTTALRQIIYFALFVFTLILSTAGSAQIIWQETFDIPNKGYWADNSGTLISDLENINWTLDVTGCEFSDENDYAKTVSTKGGRFEVLDSDGEVVVTTQIIDIAGYDLINISLDASETSNGVNINNKYLKAFYKVDEAEIAPFTPDSMAAGDWGATRLIQQSLNGNTLQIIIKMNSSYANDRIILDNIMVEAIDSTRLVPSKIEIIQSPLFAFTGDTVIIGAVTMNSHNEVTIDSSLLLQFAGNNLTAELLSSDAGYYYWKVVASNMGEAVYQITDHLNKLTPADCSINIFSKDDALLIEIFEAGSFQGWDFGTQWEVSTDRPIAGVQSVKHVKQAEGGRSSLVYEGSSFNLNEKEYLFSFKIKNGNWDPTNANLFYIWLTSQGSNDQHDGYAIGVNAQGITDMVSLWKMRNGVAVELIAVTAFDWSENQTAQINCIRSARGEWILGATDLVTGATHTATAFDNEFDQINNIRLEFVYTVTPSGELWFDDLVVIGQNAPPYIVNVVPLEHGVFRVIFNEPIQTGQLTTTSFKLESENGTNYPIQSIEVVSNTEIMLRTSNINDFNLILTAYAIKDLDGQESAQLRLEFDYTIAAVLYDLVITEIMADPNPQVGLPLAEYIELHNRSNKNIQLENWRLFVRNTSYPIPKRVVKPGEYVVLCDDLFASAYTNQEQLIIFSSFPALLNAGTYLNIANPQGTLIDEVTYSDSWYGDNVKKNGGYSLERIDLNRFCNPRENWTGSNDPTGGTPGKVNSVNGNNPDGYAPELVAVNIVSYTVLEAIFDEPLDTVLAQLSSNYKIPGLSVANVEYTAGNNVVIINLRNPLVINTEYQLEIAQLADECENVSANLTAPFSMAALSQGDILITEVLFDPLIGGSDFVELYNNSGLTIDLFNLRFANRDDSLNLKPVYEVSLKHASFRDKTYMAFSKDTANILNTYYVPDPRKLFQVERLPAYNKDKGRVVLLSDSMVVIDEVAYHENMHDQWLRNGQGVSLERVSLEKEAALPSNWRSATSLGGYATPGYANSQTDIDDGQQLAIELASEVVSPNGDGYNDELIITFKLDQPGYLANVYIFNAMGIEVKRLINNDLIGNMNQVVYDLRNHRGELLPMGTYVVLAELIHFDTKKQVFKLAFHVTDRR